MKRVSREAFARVALAALVLSLGAASACFAQQLILTPFKAGGIYKLGEKAGWWVDLPPGVAASGEYSYTVKQNNFTVIQNGKLDPAHQDAGGNARIEVTLNEPAMLYVEVKPASAPDAKPQVVGAAIAPDLLQPVAAEPGDFEDFWAEKIKLLRKIPANAVVEPGSSNKEGVEYFKLTMDHIDGKRVYGQIAKPAGPGPFPGLVMFQWASPPYPLQKQWVTERAAEGWLAVNIEPHDVPINQPQSYYDALPQALKEYHTIGRDDRDRNYFLQMYLADYRAVEYLASRPDWNRKTLVATGTSMGGQQSFCAAGLNPKVTAMIVHVPAGADAAGPLRGRASGYPGWPTDNPQIQQTAQYFDIVNCARRIKVPSLVSMGFVDTVTPPVGIWTAFNQIRAYKEAVPLVDSPHNHLATPEQQAPYTQRSAEWLKTLAAGGDIAERADRPSPRLDANSMAAHQVLLQKKQLGQIDLYFLGDSITRRWGATDEPYKPLLENWQRNFLGWNAADFGWGGDKTQNILWRLSQGELDGVKPKVIVLMAGTNNVGRLTPVGDDQQRVEEISRGVEAIVKACRDKAPKATIILMGITPRNDNIAVMPTINRINANLARLANGKNIRYLSINRRLADDNGVLFEGMTDPDQLHLTAKAYQVWADALRPVLTDLLGPRGSVDHAPPPTGDPGVR